jgi:hypothetical protein
MASAFKRGRCWYLRVKDGTGRWLKIRSEARTKVEAQAELILFLKDPDSYTARRQILDLEERTFRLVDVTAHAVIDLRERLSRMEELLNAVLSMKG